METQALLHGLMLRKKKQIINMTVEVDLEVLVHLLITKAVGKWLLCILLRKIRHLLYEVSAIINHVWRQVNSIVDGLAALVMVRMNDLMLIVNFRTLLKL